MSGSLVFGDWGSTRLRLWQVDGTQITGRASGQGIAMSPNPAQELARALGSWSPSRIILCGMAGARNGLHEVPYSSCPLSKDDWVASSPRISLSHVELRIAAGVATRQADGRPDVMRGEETQIFGAMTLYPALSSGAHLALLPDTHSKWVRIVDGRIDSFRTYITGELFELLNGSSLYSTGAAEGDEEKDGFQASQDRAGYIGATLFEARTRQLLDGKSASWARGFVSGLLVSAELEDAKPRSDVTIIGDKMLSQRYSSALERTGIKARVLDDERCTIAGLRLLDVD